jgi:hypothetical protein
VANTSIAVPPQQHPMSRFRTASDVSGYASIEEVIEEGSHIRAGAEGVMPVVTGDGDYEAVDQPLANNVVQPVVQPLRPLVLTTHIYEDMAEVAAEIQQLNVVATRH